jgi:hypothetical protein
MATMTVGQVNTTEMCSCVVLTYPTVTDAMVCVSMLSSHRIVYNLSLLDIIPSLTKDLILIV